MFKFLKIFVLYFFLSLPVYGEEQNKFESEHQWNFYSGMFDFIERISQAIALYIASSANL